MHTGQVNLIFCTLKMQKEAYGGKNAGKTKKPGKTGRRSDLL